MFILICRSRFWSSSLILSSVISCDLTMRIFCINYDLKHIEILGIIKHNLGFYLHYFRVINQLFIEIIQLWQNHVWMITVTTVFIRLQKPWNFYLMQTDTLKMQKKGQRFWSWKSLEYNKSWQAKTRRDAKGISCSRCEKQQILAIFIFFICKR